MLLLKASYIFLDFRGFTGFEKCLTTLTCVGLVWGFLRWDRMRWPKTASTSIRRVDIKTSTNRIRLIRLFLAMNHYLSIYHKFHKLRSIYSDARAICHLCEAVYESVRDVLSKMIWSFFGPSFLHQMGAWMTWLIFNLI